MAEEKTELIGSHLRQAKFSRDITDLKKNLQETRAELTELKQLLAPREKRPWLRRWFRRSSSTKPGKLGFWKRLERSIRKRRDVILGRKPAAVSPEMQRQIDLIKSSGYFNADWYCRRYSKAAAAADPVEHYVRIGAQKNMDPCPLFDTKMYRLAHDLAEGENPLIHFLNAGAKATAGAYPNEEAFRKIQAGFHERTSIEIIKDERKGNRRFAVFLQCSANANHREWFTQIPRTWDLLVNLFQDQSEAPEGSDLVMRQTGGGCQAAVIAYMMKHCPEILRSYDYWMALDDDILTSVDDLNLLFQIVNDHQLDMAQPSLTRDSCCVYPVLFADPLGGMRKLNATESMVPIFSRRLIDASVSLFSESISGGAIDLVMGKITRTQLGTDPTVIDAVSVRHCKKVDYSGGGYYQFLQKVKISTLVESRLLVAKYGSESTIFELGKEPPDRFRPF